MTNKVDVAAALCAGSRGPAASWAWLDYTVPAHLQLLHARISIADVTEINPF